MGRDDPSRPVSIDAETRADFEALGVTIKDEGHGDDGGEADDAVEVWDENWESVIAFLALETQWRVASGFSGSVWLGLDYVAADVVLRRRRFGRKRADRIFEDLQVMERSALSTFAELRSRDS